MIVIYDKTTGEIQGSSDKDFTIQEMYPDNVDFQNKYDVLEVTDHTVIENKQFYKVVNGSIVNKSDTEIQQLSLNKFTGTKLSSITELQAENQDLKNQLASTNADFQSFMDFYFNNGGV